MGSKNNSFIHFKLILLLIITLIFCNLITCAGGKLKESKKQFPKSGLAYISSSSSTSNTNFDYFLKLLNKPFEWLNPFGGTFKKIQNELNNRADKIAPPIPKEPPFSIENNFKYLQNNPDFAVPLSKQSKEPKINIHTVSYNNNKNNNQKLTLTENFFQNNTKLNSNYENLNNNFNFHNLTTKKTTKRSSVISTTMTHKPITYSSSECHSRGRKVGDLMNICEREDCSPTKLRCPPDYDLLPPYQYFNANLTTCRLEEVFFLFYFIFIY